jgi:hypothetical protein
VSAVPSYAAAPATAVIVSPGNAAGHLSQAIHALASAATSLPLSLYRMEVRSW